MPETLMKPRPDLRWLAPVALLASAPCHAEVYFDVQQVQAALFPGVKLSPIPLLLSNEQMRDIAQRSGIGVSDPRPHVWQAENGGWLYIDRVIGKHDYITFALALNADGSVRKVEIMEYREGYGGQVRNERWRDQFIGKDAAHVPQAGGDIKNISGATLSCSHLTDGIRRLLVTHAIALQG